MAETFHIPPADDYPPEDQTLDDIILGGEDDEQSNPVTQGMFDQYVQSGQDANPDISYPEPMIREWLDSLPPDRRATIEATREWNLGILSTEEHDRKVARTGLLHSAPELLKGRLPVGLAEKMQGQEYVLGVRNQAAAETVEDARQEVARAGGLDLAGQSILQSMIVVGPEDPTSITEDKMIDGYYGADCGKFVAVLPHPNGLHASDVSRFYRDQNNGIDSFYIGGDSASVVNPRYLAGFIDSRGIFHPNSGFMESGFVIDDKDGDSNDDVKDWL